MPRVCTPPKKSPCPELSMLPRAQAEHHNTFRHGNELADTRPSSTSSLLDQGSSSTCQRRTPKSLSSSLVYELQGLLGTLLRNPSHMEQRHTSSLPNTYRGMSKLVSFPYLGVADNSIRLYGQARWIHWSNVPRWNQCSCRARTRGFGKCPFVLCRWPSIWSRTRECRGGS